MICISMTLKTHKFCYHCNTKKVIEDFPKDKYSPDGHRSICRPCKCIYNKKWKVGIAGRIHDWRGGAKKRNIEWGLTNEYIKSIPLICYYSGIPLTYDYKKANTASLDRRDNTKGYVPDNVVMCSVLINRMKQTLSEIEFEAVCQQIVDYKKQTRLGQS